jgi:hypothetical protein
VALLEVVEDAGEAAQRFRHGEQAQGVGGGGGVDDHLVEVRHLVDTGPPRQPGDLQPGHQLVGAGEGEVEEALDVPGVQVGAAGGDLA